MEEEIENFIDDRINKNYSYLSKSKKWQEANKEYHTAYDSLYQELTLEQQKKLENILSIKNILLGYESNFTYQLGKNDTLELIKPQFIL